MGMHAQGVKVNLSSRWQPDAVSMVTSVYLVEVLCMEVLWIMLKITNTGLTGMMIHRPVYVSIPTERV